MDRGTLSKLNVYLEVQWLAKSASAQTHSFKESAPLLDPGPYQKPYRTQSSAYRGLRARYLLVPTACCSTVIYYFAVSQGPL
jgi:hypothetical protein